MDILKNKKIAIVCDWIKDWGGAEKVLEELLITFPQADIFTSIFFPPKNISLFQNHTVVPYGKKIPQNISSPHIYTSFIQQIPLLSKSHKLCLALRQTAFESFDLSDYDIVISSTSAESKGIITKPTTLHICYCHTPTRYFWSQYENYKHRMEFGLLNPIAKLVFPRLITGLRKWDFVAAQRPDYYIANSQNTQAQIQKYYNRESTVIYPPIEVAKFDHTKKRKDFYLCVGRCIPYKKFDLLVDAFNKNGKDLILVTNTDNKLYRKLQAKSAKNIQWKLNISRQETQELFETAKCFVFPPEEDFGIVPLEATSAGCPVIAYKKGGALETVVEGKTGVFFEKQTPESLQKSIDAFESMTFDPNILRKHAESFSSEVFRRNIIEFINEKL